ncbi:unnamed protein product, partial [Urochloa humidicola]
RPRVQGRPPPLCSRVCKAQIAQQRHCCPQGKVRQIANAAATVVLKSRCEAAHTYQDIEGSQLPMVIWEKLPQESIRTRFSNHDKEIEHAGTGGGFAGW